MAKAIRDRVGIKTRTGIIEGTVYKVDRKGVHILGDNGGGFTVPATYNFAAAKGKAPADVAAKLEELIANEANAPKWAKGNRVSIDNDGTTLNGTLASGGARPLMILDGGKEQIRADARSFRPGPPLPTEPPSHMDRWTVRKYSLVERLSEETNCFTAEILRDGKLAIHASNPGHGGSDEMHPAKGLTYEVIAEFEADAKKWFADHGIDETFEPGSSWIEFTVHKRPFAVTTEAYMEEQREFWARLAKMR